MEILKRIVVILFVVISFLWMLRVLFLPGYPDYQVHYYGAGHLVQHENPYLSDSRYFTPQVYPPFDMVFFIPLSFFPYDISSKVWIVISIVSILLSICFLNKLYKESFFSSLSLFLSGLVFLAFPTKFTLGMGQINAVILLFTVALFYFLNNKKFFRAGIALAFSAMLKFFPLLALPYLILRKKFKILIAFVLSVLLIFLVSLYFVPYDVQYIFFSKMLPDLLASWKGDYYNQSITGVIMRQVEDPNTRQTLRVIIPLGFLFITGLSILWKYKKEQFVINLEFSLLIIVSILINNFSWQHHFILLLLPFFVLIYTVKNILKDKIIYIFLAIAYALIAINFTNPLELPKLVQSHVFFGGLLLWIINLYMLIKLKNSKIEV